MNLFPYRITFIRPVLLVRLICAIFTGSYSRDAEPVLSGHIRNILQIKYIFLIETNLRRVWRKDVPTFGKTELNSYFCGVILDIMGKKLILMALAALAISYPACLCAEEYVPSAEVRKSQAEFSSDRFGIFIHWGIYSMFARGEWYLNNGPLHSEYSKHARG